MICSQTNASIVHQRERPDKVVCIAIIRHDGNADQTSKSASSSNSSPNSYYLCFNPRISEQHDSVGYKASPYGYPSSPDQRFQRSSGRSTMKLFFFVVKSLGISSAFHCTFTHQLGIQRQRTLQRNQKVIKISTCAQENHFEKCF